MDENLKNIIEKLDSTDPEERRIAIADLPYDLSEDKLAEKLAKMLLDEDKGVKDAASMYLTFAENPKISDYIVDFIASDEIGLRNLAGDILIKRGVNASSSLIKYINNYDYNHRKFAIDVLGLQKNPSAIPNLVEQLNIETDENVLLAIFEALGNIGSENALDILFEYWEKNELFRPTISEAFGKIGSERALEFMIEKYPEEDAITKYSIIECLGLIGDESTYYFLLGEQKNISGPLLWPIIQSIYQLKEKFQLDLPFDDSIKKTIINTLNEADVQFRKAAAYLITEFDDKDIIEALLRIFGEDFELDDNIRQRLFEHPKLFLIKLTELIYEKPKNSKNLLGLLKELSDATGGQGFDFLSAFESESLYDAVFRCREHPDEEVRRLSTELMFSMNANKALVFIDSLIQDENIWNKIQILEILEGVFDPKINEILIKFANDNEEMISEKAKEILSFRGIEI